MKRIISGILIQFAVISSVFAAPFTPYQVLTATALNAAIAAPNITGGTIDAAPIGVTTPSSGNFTTLATGSLTASGAISGASISGAGTGLTGTAAGLNVGGYSATANSSPAIGLTGTTIAPSVVSSSLTSAAGGAFGSGAYATAYVLPTATPSLLGGVKPDGTTITNTSGAISVTYGTIAGTAAQGGVVTAGSSGSATVVPIITYNAAGQLTTVSVSTITPAIGSVTGLGTGIGASLSVNVGTAGAPVVLNGAGGTPSSIVLTNATGTATGLVAGNYQSAAALSGALNGSNQTYTLPQLPKGTPQIYINGIAALATVEYTIAGVTVTHIGTALGATDTFTFAEYRY